MKNLDVGVGEIYFYKVIFILTRTIFLKVFCTSNFKVNMLNTVRKVNKHYSIVGVVVCIFFSSS